jgi:signal transduction histidine kinase/ligand-binding sensor domain-containing protein/AraC-like DNA-binding protein
LDIADGLSDNQIRSFVQTSDGRLAIQLVSNLNIYNGASFEHFYQDRWKDYKWTFDQYQVFKEYEDAQRRLWLKNPGYLSIFDLNTNQFICNIETVLASYGITQRLKDMFIDSDKNLWFLTDDNTFSFYNISQKRLYEIETGDSPFTRQFGFPKEIAQYKNLYWIVYSSGLIRCWDSVTQEYILQETYFLNKISEITSRLAIIPASNGDLWLMHNAEVCFYSRIEKTWKEVAVIKGASNFFTAMALDRDGNAWVGTSWSGLWRIDGKTHEIEVIAGLKLTNGETSYNDIQCVFVDDNNGLWIGTLWQGICYYHPSMYKFKLVQTAKNEFKNNEGSVRCMIEGDDNHILIGTSHYGLLQYNVTTGDISKAYNGLITDDICLTLYRDRKKRLWIGTYLNGFYCIDGQNIRTYNCSKQDMERFPNQNISRAIYEDENGRYWVSVDNEGVGELDLSTGKITLLKEKHQEIEFHKVDFNFYPVDKHSFAVYGESGLYYYDTQNDKIFIPERDAPDNPQFMKAGIRYYCIFKDSRGLEWFGTERGLKIMDNETNQSYSLTTDDGLHNNTIMAILEDDYHTIWLSTANGITKVNVSRNGKDYVFSIVNFNTMDGVQNGKFYEKSALKTDNGNLYFGGIQGFNVFNPEKIVYNQSQQKPVFTALKLFHQNIKENTRYKGRIILNQPINNINEIHLKYNENNITLEFSGLNYVKPAQSFYRYKLENFDGDWMEILTDGAGFATYTGLKPGTYLFKVRAANNDKLWGNELAEMKIVISPPFWATLYAFIIYVLMTLGSFAGLFFFVNNKHKKQLEKRQIEENRKQKEELDQMKFRFFTNISHEFRTPLTLIMTPLSIMMKQTNDEQERQKLSLIYKNTENILDLINQLLDFRKLEMGGEKLKLSFDDFINFSEYVYVTFKEIASDSHSIDFTFESQNKQLLIWFDKEKVRKILNNLYSNALKFTPKGGHIATEIHLQEEDGREFVKVVIADTGCGISEKEQQIIFERFYQSENNFSEKAGYGIGLHLVKEYVELHGGKITVDSKVNEGSAFSVFIPTDLKGEEYTKIPAISTEQKDIRKRESRKTLLIVEDHTDFRQLLANQLNSQFNVLQAADGEDGENIAQTKYPDLIVSDLMMPRMDGLELCRRLKNNIKTSHIPVILLTARLSDDAKIESYKSGADSYIAKPFNFDVLQIRIEMLIEQQEKRKKLFHKTIDVQPNSITTTSLDEEFIKKALQYVEENIANPDYSNDDLSRDLGMSRSNMYPKLQSITGLTPNNFIRSIRLKRAAQLLKTTQYTVSEIAWMAGFNSIKYFNKYFKENFGKTPTEYKEDAKKQS